MFAIGRRGSGRKFWFCRAEGNDQPTTARIKGAADFHGHFNLLLRASAGEQGRIQSQENFSQGQRNQNPITIGRILEKLRSRPSQVAEGDCYGPTRQLRHDFFQRNVDRGAI